MRVVLDTNVLLSGLAFPQSLPGRIVGAWRAGSIDAVLPALVLDELARTLPRLQHRHRLSEAEQRDLVDSLALLAEVCTPDEASLLAARDSGLAARDGHDVPVLAALLHSRAEWLVSGDKDLLVLSHRFPVLSPAQFCARYSP